MMRVLLIGDYPPDARLGSAKVYFKLAEALRELGHECDVLLGDALGAWPDASRLRWIAAPWLALRAARRAGVTRGHYEVVDVASAEGAWLALAERARRDGPRVGIVSRSHGLEHRNYARMLDDARAGLQPKSWWRRWWYPLSRLWPVSLAARASDRMIVLNARDRDEVVQRGWKSGGEVLVVPHGVSERFLASAPAAGAARGAGIVFCGSWDLVKGVTYLAEAFLLLRATHPQARLTVLGPGVPEAHVLASFAPSVRPFVRVIPRAGEAEVMAEFARHDVLVSPSTYEGFGMVMLEAMSQRLPVVATPEGAALSLVQHAVTGVVVPARDARALSTALAGVLDDRASAELRAEAAYAVALQHGWRETARRTVDVYRAAREAASAR
ncbi:MAG: hypothetical protein JWO05_1741 [Gemmatimonadetes bacterium]|nr:hypothetical protein [Gemmatimonadota bacterium]